MVYTPPPAPVEFPVVSTGSQVKEDSLPAVSLSSATIPGGRWLTPVRIISVPVPSANSMAGSARSTPASIEDFWPQVANTRLLGCSNKAGAVAVRSDFFGREDVYLTRVDAGRASEDIHRVPDVSERYGSVGMTDDGTLVVYQKMGQRLIEGQRVYSGWVRDWG